MIVAKIILKWMLGAAMVLAGINHFINAEFYLRMMPPILPAPLFLIYLSGFFEITLGILLVIPRFTRLAAFGLILLFIAVLAKTFYLNFCQTSFITLKVSSNIGIQLNSLLNACWRLRFPDLII